MRAFSWYMQWHVMVNALESRKQKNLRRGFSIQQQIVEIWPPSLTVFPAVPSRPFLFVQVRCHVYTVTDTGTGNCVVRALLFCHRRDFSFCRIQCGCGGADALCEGTERHYRKNSNYNYIFDWCHGRIPCASLLIKWLCWPDVINDRRWGYWIKSGILDLIIQLNWFSNNGYFSNN